MAIAIPRGTEFVTQLCEALGLDPKHTHRIIIDVTYDCIPTVYVQMYPTPKILDVDFGAGLKLAVRGGQICTEEFIDTGLMTPDSISASTIKTD